MNITGHIAVASASNLTPLQQVGTGRAAVMLGSALPDICNIAGVRIENRSSDTNIARGVELHHQTDAAFHSHPWFREIMRQAMDDLTQRGVNRGAARACAHIGPELLIDGALLEDGAVYEETSETFRSIASLMPKLTPMVKPASQDRWTTTLSRLADMGAPADHSDPHLVANRMQRILQNRPRLALLDSSVGAVTEVLRTIQPQVMRDANWLVSDIADTLNDGPTNS